MLRVSEKPKAVQTVKLTPVIGSDPRVVSYRRDIQTFDPSNEPNRPHISSVLAISKSVETNMTGCALASWRAPPVVPLIFFLRLVAVPAVSGVSRPSGAPWCISAPPVRGVLRLVTEARNPFFRSVCIFCDRTGFGGVFRGLRHFSYPDAGSDCKNVRRATSG